MTVNAAGYYIDWSDIQLRVAANPASYLINAGQARLYGGEISVSGNTGFGLTYGVNLGLVHSSLDRVPNPAIGAVVGARIPDSPDTTLSSFTQYTRAITDDANIFVRGEVDYRSREAVTLVTTTAPTSSFYVDGFATGKLQAGIETSRYGLYTYVNNITDERRQIGKVYSAAIPSLGYAAETQLELIRSIIPSFRLSEDTAELACL